MKRPSYAYWALAVVFGAAAACVGDVTDSLSAGDGTPAMQAAAGAKDKGPPNGTNAGGGGQTAGQAGATSHGGATAGASGHGGGNTGGASGAGGGKAGNGGMAAGGAGGRDFSDKVTDFGLGGDSRCSSAHVQLCEDFEGAAIDTTIWSIEGTPPSLGADHVARGKKALHITQPHNGSSLLRETMTFPAKNNTYFGRMFVYFAALPKQQMGYAHWTFLAASGSGIPGEIRVSGQLTNGANYFGVGTDSGADPKGTGDWTSPDDDPKGSPKPVPEGEWMCIEWMHNGAKNETAFYWNGDEHPSLHTTPTMSGSTTGSPYILPQFENVWIGWAEYQDAMDTFELWIDEVAIDASRIGCVL